MRMRVIFLWAFLILSFLVLPAQGSAVEVYEADTKPWSGYWWPSTHGGMLTGVSYRGRPSVLDKLQAISSAQSAQVTEWYKQNFYKPDGESWFGLCHAWALAAASEPEPVRGSVFRGVPLTIGEKKAFLTLAHAQDVTYRGNGYDPLVFHQWVLRFLKENKKPFVINLGQGGEVWFYPVYRAEVESQDFSDRTEFSTLLWYASNDVLPDFTGTLEGMSRQTYILYKDGAGQYSRGRWTGDSLTRYPIALWSTLERQGPPGFDMATVDAAVTSKTDDLSTNLLRPGSFSSFFKRVWGWQLEAQGGEWLELEFSLENRQVSALVQISDGVFSLSKNVTQADPLIRYMTRKANPTLTISVAERLINSPFSLRYELARTPLAALTRRDANLEWTGLAGVANLQAETADALLVTARARDGRPLRSEPLPITGRAKFGQVIDFPGFDSWAFGRAEHLEVTSKSAPAFVGLSANFKGMSSFSTVPSQGYHVAYGALSSTGASIAFYVRNYEPRAVNGTIRAWEGFGEGWLGAGNQILSTDITLNPHELRFFSWGAPPLPFTRAPGLFSIDFGEAHVGLDACFADRSSMEMIPGVGEFAKDFLFSHYPNADGWETSLHILNPYDTTVEVWIENVSGRRLRTIFIPPHRSAEVETAVLPQTGATLRVRSDVGIAAHVRYQAAGGDWAMLPLVRADRTSTEFLVPHVPDAPWWTGIILDHPGPESCEVTLEYFGTSGEILHTERRVLNGYEPWVFAATRSAKTAYLKIHSSSALGCGVLYGSDDLAHLAGYVP